MKISVILEALTGRFETDFGRATKKAAADAKKLQSQIDGSFNRIRDSIKGAVVGLAGILTVREFAGFIKSSIDAADELGKLSQKVGVATDELSKLQYAARLADVDTDGLQQALVKLSKSSIEAKDGTGDAAAAFKALGVSVVDANGNVKSNYDLLIETADAFSTFTDGTEKSAAAMAIFGKTGADLIPLLNGGSAAIRDAGSELERFGGVVTPEAARQAEAFNDSLTKLEAQAGAVGRGLAADLLPALQNVSDELSGLAAKGEVKEFARDATVALATVAESAYAVAKAIYAIEGSFEAVLADMQVAFQFLKGGGIPGLIVSEDSRKALAAELERRNKTVEDANQRYVDLWTYNGTALSDAIKQGFEQADTAIGNYVPSLEGVPTVLDLVEKRTLKYSAALDEQADKTKKAKKEIDEFTRQFEIQQEAIANINEAVAANQKIVNDRLSEAAAVFEATRTPAERYRAELDKLNAMLERGDISLDTYNRAVADAQVELRGLEETTKEVTDEMTQYAEEAARNIQDAFAEFLFDPFDKGVKGMLDSFEETLRRMAANQAAAQLLGSFGGSGGGFDFSGLLGTVVSGLGSFFGGSSVGTAAVTSNTGGIPLPRAIGGPVTAGMSYMVGERGPELFVPDVSGRIEPAGAKSADGVQVVNNFYVTSSTGSLSRETQEQVAARAGMSVQRAVRRNL